MSDNFPYYSSVVFAEKIAKFRDKIEAMPDDLVDPFSYLDAGKRKPFSCSVPLGAPEKIVYLPEAGSDFANFRDLIWCGTHESVVDIIERKAKKHKFLNDIVNVKQRFLSCLDFIAAHGDKNIYWSKGLNPELTCVPVYVID